MKKKELQQQIDELKRRVNDLENYRFTYTPQVTFIPYTPPLGGAITIGDPLPYDDITTTCQNQSKQ